VCACEKETAGEIETVFRQREKMRKGECTRVREYERQRKRVCMCMCERERDRKIEREIWGEEEKQGRRHKVT
jgi:hypothetical protein